MRGGASIRNTNYLSLPVLTGLNGYVLPRLPPNTATQWRNSGIKIC
jgi:hypothetical protein